MLKRYITILITAAIVVGLLFIAFPGTQAAEGDTSIYTLLETYPMELIDYLYMDGDQGRGSSIYYSPALLLQDSRSLSGDLAKASVALAMSAYSREYVNNLLHAMEFTTYDNTYVYDRSANDLTLYDNDYVAYTIAYRDVVHPVSGDTYRIYCVPIQGTPKNAEWFSDFNLGTGVEHEGFSKAAQEVYNKLLAYFANDGVDADHRIVWTAGHSRGASCANLLSGWLSRSDERYTKAEHVFGYTFACPAVSLQADQTLKNIYNFNNAGDMVTMIPMAEWGYRRYGVDITLDNSAIQMDNVRLQFQRVTGNAYAGEIDGTNYHTLLTEIIGTDRYVFYTSPTLQATLALAGFALGGSNDTTIWEIFAKYLNGFDRTAIRIEWDVIALSSLASLLTQNYDDNDRLAVEAYKAYTETVDLTEEEFQAYLRDNYMIVWEIENAADYSIITPQSFLIARNELKQDNSIIRSVQECVVAANALVSDEDGNVMDKIGHGHAQTTYTVWINSMYYGDSGWYNNDDIQTKQLGNGILSIGQHAFLDCDNLETLTIPDSVATLGYSAFSDCAGLRTVTIPADYDITTHPFGDWYSRTNGVTTIHYTYGQTGVMMDKTGDSDMYHFIYTLEYLSRGNLQSVDFEEGITHVGGYSFYDCSSLQSVKLPSTLKSVGDYAFYYCSSLTDINLGDQIVSFGKSAFSYCTSMDIHLEFSEELTEIGSHAFYECNQLTIGAFPEDLKSIGEFAFAECDTLDEILIPDTMPSLGFAAFAHCAGLRTVTIPVDYDITTHPFGDWYSMTKGVTTIHYTYGQTGVMMDKTGDGDMYHFGYTLEHFSSGNLQSVDFEEGITHVGGYSFYDCSSLQSVKLPSTLESIGNSAFHSCYNLSDLYYDGTEKHWNVVMVGDNNAPLSDVTIHYGDAPCTDADQDHKCDICGENLGPVADSKTKFQSTGLSLGTFIGLQSAIMKSSMNGNDFDEAYFIYKQYTCDENGQLVLVDTIRGEYLDFGSYLVADVPVNAKQMSDVYEITPYYVKNDVTYYGSTKTASVKEEAMKKINDSGTTDKIAKTRALCIAMLNYGAEAQKNFNYSIINLANSQLSAAQKALPAFDELNLVKTNNIPAKPFKPAQSGMNLGDVVYMQFLVAKSKVDAAGSLIYQIPGEEAVEIPCSELDVYISSYYLINIPIKAKYVRTDITIGFANASGAVTYEMVCSIEAFATAKQGTTTENLVAALMVYGDAAKALFG